jgi:hypothetical protein
LVIDNKSQHSDVEKKRENEERKKERTTINYTKTRKKERKNMNAIIPFSLF